MLACRQIRSSNPHRPLPILHPCHLQTTAIRSMLRLRKRRRKKRAAPHLKRRRSWDPLDQPSLRLVAQARSHQPQLTAYGIRFLSCSLNKMCPASLQACSWWRRRWRGRQSGTAEAPTSVVDDSSRGPMNAEGIKGCDHYRLVPMKRSAMWALCTAPAAIPGGV